MGGWYGWVVCVSGMFERVWGRGQGEEWVGGRGSGPGVGWLGEGVARVRERPGGEARTCLLLINVKAPPYVAGLAANMALTTDESS